MVIIMPIIGIISPMSFDTVQAPKGGNHNNNRTSVLLSIDFCHFVALFKEYFLSIG